MSRVCDLTGKKAMTGNHVSFSNKKNKRKFNANLFTKKFYIPELDRWVTLRVAASTIRTIDKIGIYKYLTDLEKKGLITIVEEND